MKELAMKELAIVNLGSGGLILEHASGEETALLGSIAYAISFAATPIETPFSLDKIKPIHHNSARCCSPQNP